MNADTLLDTAVQAAHFTQRYWLAVEAAGDDCEAGTFDVTGVNSENIDKFAEQSKLLSAQVVKLTEQLADGR